MRDYYDTIFPIVTHAVSGVVLVLTVVSGVAYVWRGRGLLHAAHEVEQPGGKDGP